MLCHVSLSKHSTYLIAILTRRELHFQLTVNLLTDIQWFYEFEI